MLCSAYLNDAPDKFANNRNLDRFVQSSRRLLLTLNGQIAQSKKERLSLLAPRTSMIYDRKSVGAQRAIIMFFFLSLEKAGRPDFHTRGEIGAL